MTLHATFWEGRGQNISGERKQKKNVSRSQRHKKRFSGGNRVMHSFCVRPCNAFIIFTHLKL